MENLLERFLNSQKTKSSETGEMCILAKTGHAKICELYCWDPCIYL